MREILIYPDHTVEQEEPFLPAFPAGIGAIKCGLNDFDLQGIQAY